MAGLAARAEFKILPTEATSTSSSTAAPTKTRKHKGSTVVVATSSAITDSGTTFTLSAATETCSDGSCAPLSASATPFPSSNSSPSESATTTGSSNSVSPTSASVSSTSVIAAAASTTAAIAAPISHHSSVSSGAIAAAVVVPIVVILTIIGLLLFFVRRRRRNNRESRAFAPFRSSSGPSTAPSLVETSLPVAGDTEKNEKDLELSPIQPQAGFYNATIPRRPVGVAPPMKTPVAEIVPVSTPASRDTNRSTDSSRTYRNTPDTFSNTPDVHYPSTTVLLEKLPEVPTGHFLDGFGAASHTSFDPFDNGLNEAIPDPVQHFHSSTELSAPTSIPQPTTQAPLIATPFIQQFINTNPSTTTFNHEPISQPPPASTQRFQVAPAKALSSTYPPLVPPPAPRSPGADSDRFSNDEYDGEAEDGVIEYATAARVAHVVGGHNAGSRSVDETSLGQGMELGAGQSGGKRTSIGVVNLRNSGGSMSKRGSGGSA